MTAATGDVRKEKFDNPTTLKLDRSFVKILLPDSQSSTRINISMDLGEWAFFNHSRHFDLKISWHILDIWLCEGYST